MISKSLGSINIAKAIINMVEPERIDVVNSQLTYEGRTIDRTVDGTDQAKWQILRRIIVGGEVIRELFNDSEDADQIWDNRDSIFPVPPFANAKSLLFDGADEYINLGDNHVFGNAQAFSWGFWFKANNFAAQRCFLAKTTVDANVFGYSIQHKSAGNLYIQVRAPGTLQAFDFPTVMSAGVWTHIVLTYAGGSNMNGFTAYINGVAETVPGSFALNNWTVPDDLSIGRRGSVLYYSGNMNQVGVWDKELDAAAVLEAYNSGNPADLNIHSAAANLLSYYLLNDESNFPNELDQKGAVDGVLVNMEVGDYVADVP